MAVLTECKDLKQFIGITLLIVGLLPVTVVNGHIIEEGTELTLGCTPEKPSTTITWQRVEGAANITWLSTCNTSGLFCQNGWPFTYAANVRVTSENTYKSELKILKTDISHRNFRCVTDETFVQSYSFEIYVKPKEPLSCESPKLLQDGRTLEMRCLSEGVYPKGTCNFTNKGPTLTTMPTISAYNTNSSVHPKYFILACILSVPVTNLTAGTYNFQFEMSPTLSRRDSKAIVLSHWISTVLSSPVASLSSQCNEGPDVKNRTVYRSTTGICLCELITPGYPVGQARWYTKDGVQVGEIHPATGSASISLTDTGTGITSYVCKAESILNDQSQPISYVFTYADGPAYVYIDFPSINYTSTFDLCPSRTDTLEIMCSVYGKSVPAPNFTLKIDNKSALDNTRGQDPNEYHKDYWITYTYRPIRSGEIPVHCKGFNGAFGDRMSYSVEKIFETRAPPSEAPVLKSSDEQPQAGKDTVYVTDKDAVIHLQCEVDGGYPAVSNVTISCGINAHTTAGSRASISVQIPKGTEKLVCFCRASHVTGCYDKKTRVILSLGSVEKTMSAEIAFGTAFAVVILIFIIMAVIAWRKGICRKMNSQGHVYYYPNHMSAGGQDNHQPVLRNRPAHPIPVDSESGHYDTLHHHHHLQQSSGRGSISTETKDDPRKNDDLKGTEDHYEHMPPVDETTGHVQPARGKAKGNKCPPSLSQRYLENQLTEMAAPELSHNYFEPIENQTTDNPSETATLDSSHDYLEPLENQTIYNRNENVPKKQSLTPLDLSLGYLELLKNHPIYNKTENAPKKHSMATQDLSHDYLEPLEIQPIYNKTENARNKHSMAPQDLSHDYLEPLENQPVYNINETVPKKDSVAETPACTP